MSEHVKNVSVLAVSLLLCTLGAEGGLRVAAPQRVPRFPRGLFVADDVLRYRLAPEFRGVASTGEYRTDLRINALGLREDRQYGPKPPGARRILALGDSFTMGVGVAAADAFPKVLERLLINGETAPTMEVVNAGVPGYNTRQEREYLATRGLTLQPDLVLLNVFVGNDIHDNLTEDRVQVVDGYLVDDSEGTSNGLLPADLRAALSRSHLYQLLWPLQRRLRDRRFAVDERQRLDGYLAIYSPKSDDHVEAMWKATWSEIAAVRRLTQAQGLDLAVVIIPELRQLDAAAWRSSSRAGESTYEQDVPNRRIVEYCTAAGIPVFDLLPVFREAGQPRANYFAVDNHWTVKGNRLAAGAIAGFLTARHLVSTTARHELRATSTAIRAAR